MKVVSDFVRDLRLYCLFLALRMNGHAEGKWKTRRKNSDGSKAPLAFIRRDFEGGGEGPVSFIDRLGYYDSNEDKYKLYNIRNLF